MSEKITASGGWCAPSETLYDTGLDYKTLFPQVTVKRGGIRFDFDMTPEERAADAAWRAYINRVTSQMALARSAAIDKACLIALENKWDVHVYEPPTLTFGPSYVTNDDLIRLRCVGIEFTLAKHPIPTVHYHPYDEGDCW